MAQLETAIKHLQDAMDEAEQYVDTPDIAAEGITVHRQFIQAAATEVEKLVNTINKRNKNEAQEMPPEVREASVMAKRLSLASITLQKKEKEILQRHQDEKDEAPPKETQIVVNKAPIPPLQIPLFSGSSLHYKNFITIFDETVHKNSTLQPSQKLAYLLQYVTGDAYHVIGKMPIADVNYQIARDLLAENYGDESRNISTLYDRLRKLQPAQDEPFSLRDLYNESESIIRMLKQAGQEVETNAYLYDELLKKYPFSFLVDVIHHEEMDFENFRKEAGRVIKLRVRLAQRTDNIPIKYRAAEQRPRISTIGQKTEIPPLMQSSFPISAPEKQPIRRSIRSTDRAPPYCSFCTEQHFSDQCTKYTTLTQRKEALKDRCSRCFQKSHPQTPCLRDHPCYYCSKVDHHRALCPTKFEETTRTVQLTTKNIENRELNETKPGKFLTLLATIQNPENGHTREVRICIDPASDTTILSRQVADEMGIQMHDDIFERPHGLGGTVLPATTETNYHINIFPLSGEPIQLTTKLTTGISPNLRAPNIEDFRKKFPKHADTPIPPTGQGRCIDFLIGTDMLLKLVTLQKSIFVDDNNQLLSTRLGYLLLQGPNETNTIEEDRFTFLTQSESEIKKMWDLDIIGLKYAEEKESTMEEKALNEFYRTIRFIQNRYQVKWPWRSFPPNLPNNYGLALGRLQSLHRKLLQKSELLQAYDKIIKEQLQQDIVEIIPAAQRYSADLMHYIPHHAVIDLEKSTPVRIVYDASSKMKGYDSLNESILKGTRWTKDIVSSLLRFRIDDVAVSADVRKAFHQILIDPTERDVMRFLWIKDINKPLTEDNIEIYRFKRMAFGVIASPFLLYAVLQFHFSQNPSQTNKILAEEMYADNLLTSLPKEMDPVQFYTEARNTFAQMSMELVKWTSNDSHLREMIPDEFKIPELQTTVLGLNWDVQTDYLTIKKCRTDHLKNKKKTKRITLKILASLFDPLGWTLPIAMTARIFLRKLWEQNYKWDAPLPPELCTEWEDIQTAIEKVTEIKIPRTYIFGSDMKNKNCELHTFVDASAEAYAAVIYVRIAETGEQPISFVMARARLAPKGKLTIPRLELLAAVAGSRLTRYVIENMKLKQKVKTVLWSDSRCILAWINTLKILPAVVQRQVREIRDSHIDEFRYVPTHLNPADISTRSTDEETFWNSSWLPGPTWLRETSNWPTTDDSCEDKQNELDDRTVLLFETVKIENKVLKPNSPFSIDIHRYSDLNLLLRRTAYCIHALNLILKKDFIPAERKLDYAAAKRLWIRWDQARTFPATRDLKENEKTVLNGMTLIKDRWGILRSITRISNASLPDEMKKPILLVRKSHLTKLIILNIHQNNLHTGTSYTLAALRRTFILPAGRREVYNTLKAYCPKCRRYTTRPFKAPPTPPLPDFRVTPTETPFKNVGIDVFGPILVTNGTKEKTLEKKWVLLITCLVVRAVHLEVLHNMETNEMIAALRRFVARRGAPQLILSDNAPQFKLLDGVLSDLWRTFIQSEQGAKYFAEKDITWRFVPQYAPWMGGVYERLIQSIKQSFKRTYGEAKLTLQQFTTAIVEVEAVMNNRPLTYVDTDTDTPIITPNHFLQVRYPAIAVELQEENHQTTVVVTATRKNIINNWKTAEEGLNKYWKIWTEHYLSFLRESANTIGVKRPALEQPKEGSIVLMVDPSQRRGFWRTAVIDKLFAGGDGIARSALVRLAGGNKMIRPLIKLAPFEIAESFTEADLPYSTLPRSPQGPEDGLDNQHIEAETKTVQLRYGRYEEELDIEDESSSPDKSSSPDLSRVGSVVEWTVIPRIDTWRARVENRNTNQRAEFKLTK